MFGADMALGDQWIRIDDSYFEAPGTKHLDLGLTEAGGLRILMRPRLAGSALDCSSSRNALYCRLHSSAAWSPRSPPANATASGHRSLLFRRGRKTVQLMAQK